MKQFYILIIISILSKSISLASDFDCFYEGQRNGLSNLIANSQLKDSVAGKSYCAFYMSGCNGITSWMIAIDNISFYSVFYADSHLTAHCYQYNTVHLPKDDQMMQQLFSLINTEHVLKQIVIDSNYTPFLYYFTICDNNHKVLFEWNQSTKLLENDINSPDKVFGPICSSFLIPDLY